MNSDARSNCSRTDLQSPGSSASVAVLWNLSANETAGERAPAAAAKLPPTSKRRRERDMDASAAVGYRLSIRKLCYIVPPSREVHNPQPMPYAPDYPLDPCTLGRFLRDHRLLGGGADRAPVRSHSAGG